MKNNQSGVARVIAERVVDEMLENDISKSITLQLTTPLHNAITPQFASLCTTCNGQHAPDAPHDDYAVML